MSTRRPVDAASPPVPDGTRPKLARFDREFSRLEAIEEHNAKCRAARKGIARATRHGRRLLPLAVLLAVAGTVAAIVVGLALLSPTQTVNQVNLAFPSSATGDVVDPTISPGANDYWNVTASSGSTFNNVWLSVQVLNGGSAALTCAQTSLIKIGETITASPPYTVLTAYNASAPAGTACTATGTGPAIWYSTSLSQIVAPTTPRTYAFDHQWQGVPPAGNAKFSIVPNQ